MSTTYPLLSQEEATVALQQGKPLHKVSLPALVFCDVVFEHPIDVSYAECAGLVFDRCMFRESIQIQHTRFGGEVIFSREGRESQFGDRVVLEHCQFEGEVQARGACFQNHVSLQHSSFLARFNIPDARFSGRLDASHCQFSATVRWEGTSFAKTVSFESAIFRDKVDFRRTTFLDTAFFRNVCFEAETTFQNAQFASSRFEEMHAVGKISFKVAQFRGKSYFHHAHFAGELVLRGADVRDIFYFNHVICEGVLDAQGMECLNNATFDHTVFHEQVDFTDTVFHRDLGVRHSSFCRDVTWERAIFRMRFDCIGTTFASLIDLYGVNANELLIERKQVEGHLLSAQNQEHERSKHVYVLLRNHFDLQGKHEDADWAYYRFRQAERKADTEPGIGPGFRRFFNWFLFDLGSGYGTKPLHVTLLAAVVILLFAGIYWTWSGAFVIDAAIGGMASPHISFGQALYISASTFTTLGTNGIAPHFQSWLKYCVVLEGFLGLFLMTVFVGVYTRKMAK